MQLLSALVLVCAATALAAATQTCSPFEFHDQIQSAELNIGSAITSITQNDNSTAQVGLTETREDLGALEGALLTLKPDLACNSDVSSWPAALTPADGKERAIDMLRDAQDMLGNIDEAVGECNTDKVESIFCATLDYVLEVEGYFSA